MQVRAGQSAGGAPGGADPLSCAPRHIDLGDRIHDALAALVEQEPAMGVAYCPFNGWVSTKPTPYVDNVDMGELLTDRLPLYFPEVAAQLAAVLAAAVTGVAR